MEVNEKSVERRNAVKCKFIKIMAGVSLSEREDTNEEGLEVSMAQAALGRG